MTDAPPPSGIARIGPYTLGQVIGSGGTSTVYHAQDTARQQAVAVKVLWPLGPINDEMITRFQREIKAVRALDHPNIVPILDAGQHEGRFYLVMPLHSAGSLEDRLDKGHLKPDEGLRIIGQVSEALDYVHAQDLVHRDIKPANILFDEQGNAMLTDFGLVHLPDASISLTGSAVVGTPRYMAPEQARGDKIDKQADQYALGVILFQLLTGKLPFEADTPLGVIVKHITEPMPLLSSLRPHLAGPIERVIQKATAKEPEDRFASVGEMNAAFQQAVRHAQNPAATVAPDVPVVVSGQETLLLPDGPDEPPPPAKPTTPRWRRWGLIGASVLFMIFACPLLASAALGLLEAVSNPVAAEAPLEEGTDPEATHLAATIHALSTEVAAQQASGLSSSDIETAVFLTLNAHTITPEALTQEAVGKTQSAQAAVIMTQSATAANNTQITPSPTSQDDAATATQTATTISASPSPTPTTAVPTHTQIPPSHTATKTNPPASTKTPTPTDTELPAISDTATPTLTITPTETFIPTQTDDVCGDIYLDGFYVDDPYAFWWINNNTSETIKIMGIYLEWPEENEKLKRIKLDWQIIALPHDPDPPTMVSSGWEGPFSWREVDPFSAKQLIFEFIEDAEFAPYFVEVTFFNGCQAVGDD